MRKQEPADAYVSRLLLFLLLFAFCARDALLAVDPQVALLGFCRLIDAFGGAADAVFNHAATSWLYCGRRGLASCDRLR
ncbi:hypothetical protein SAMN05660235_02285 [Sporolituus thermophilus DSM 23256]|uniref:Uncharacterized protein n=1 Tax=Sporolituus thermophilus DSM 23256 TaxID=1123285 RepID=A0A1G7MUG5_9FIRM|nr:hypothetical protein SAMN05660235_02285 [Sporolituus thermophilus DSM 23256]